MSSTRGATLVPVLALLCNAFIWGVSWWPFRQLEALGLHPLWTTAIIYTLCALALLALRPQALGEVLRTPALWLVLAAAGVTNATFNWAVTAGDVVRVVLLFYLMPAWALLLARLLLGEALTALALLRVLLALAGAAIVLWPQGAAAWPVPQGVADWLALLGGFSFALNNVMLRREAQRSAAARALAMFAGGALVAGALAVVLSVAGTAPWPPAPGGAWMLGAVALGLLFLFSNLALQHGASRLPASATAVVMVSEVLFASVSAVLLGAGVVTAPLLLGAALILLATVLSTRK
jgi:drug/metabolite transporter (DMT)-like permease